MLNVVFREDYGAVRKVRLWPGTGSPVATSPAPLPRSFACQRANAEIMARVF